jgi:thiamine-phosphate diphosphorylase
MAADAPPHVTRAQRALRLRGPYVIINDSPKALALANATLDGGVRVLQYRAKDGVHVERLTALRALTRKRDALLMLDDDWRVALAADCDGVHLGPGDDGFDNPRVVREAAPHLIVGLSCGTTEEVENASEARADYLGIGAVFATASKDDAGAPIGIEGLRRLAARTPLPVAAIGGIDAANLLEVRRCGVAMAAVIGAVANAPDPARAAEELVAIWNAAS